MEASAAMLMTGGHLKRGPSDPAHAPVYTILRLMFLAIKPARSSALSLELAFVSYWRIGRGNLHPPRAERSHSLSRGL